jgi:hypothetical protein
MTDSHSTAARVAQNRQRGYSTLFIDPKSADKSAEPSGTGDAHDSPSQGGANTYDFDRELNEILAQRATKKRQAQTRIPEPKEGDQPIFGGRDDSSNDANPNWSPQSNRKTPPSLAVEISAQSHSLEAAQKAAEQRARLEAQREAVTQEYVQQKQPSRTNNFDADAFDREVAAEIEDMMTPQQVASKRAAMKSRANESGASWAEQNSDAEPVTDWRRVDEAMNKGRASYTPNTFRPQQRSTDDADALELLDESLDDDPYAFTLDEQYFGDNDNEETGVSRSARYRQIALSLGAAGVAAAMMAAVLTATNTPGGTGSAQIETATLVQSTDNGVIAPVDSTPHRTLKLLGDMSMIETSSLGGYLDRSRLLKLLKAKPIKCVLPTPRNTPIGPSMLELAATDGKIVCAETVDYRSTGAHFTHRSRVDGGGILEINAPYSIDGDAVCHHIRGLSAYVMGEGVPLAKAVSIERLVKANYAATPGGRICYRLREAFGANGIIAYTADVFINGRLRQERSDVRPFVMRGRN